jgi:peptide chain release factor 1
VAKTPSPWCWSSSASTAASLFGGAFSAEILDQRPGLLVFRAEGKGAEQTFADEPGGHRWQRIPPNERHGRVQTSTVTVAILPEPEDATVHLDERDLDYQATRGSGAGGQNRNKVSSAIILTYRPTGLQVRCETERDQGKNKKLALSLLKAKLLDARVSAVAAKENGARRAQVGLGQRGDKRRTIRSDGVVDHITGKRWRLKDYMRGEW